MMPAKQYKAFGIEIDSLGYYLNRAFFVTVKLLNKELKDSGLDIQHAEYGILKILIELKELTQMQIANILGKERSGVSRTLAVMEEKELIKRTQKDSRTNLITLSEKSEKLIPLLNEIADRVTARATKGFTQKRKETLIADLTRVYYNALED